MRDFTLVFLIVTSGLRTAAAQGVPGPQLGQPWMLPESRLALQPVPSGEFEMGSPLGESGRFPNEGPVTHVILTHRFWLGRTEVTQGEWTALTGRSVLDQARLMLEQDRPVMIEGKPVILRENFKHSAHDDPASAVWNLGDDLPIYWVTWNQAADFCRKVTAREGAAGRLPPGYVYRLPTAAEWEYACRAGTTSATYAGDLIIRGKSNAPILDAIGWYAGNSSVGYQGKGMDTDSPEFGEKQYPGGIAGPRRVGTKRPNPWGLSDMLGNMWEWCSDFASEGLPGGSVRDLAGPKQGTLRFAKGGSWFSGASFERAACRRAFAPDYMNDRLGFRLCLGPILAP